MSRNEPNPDPQVANIERLRRNDKQRQRKQRIKAVAAILRMRGVEA